jgi:hypothetical protein
MTTGWIVGLSQNPRVDQIGPLGALAIGAPSVTNGTLDYRVDNSGNPKLVARSRSIKVSGEAPSVTAPESEFGLPVHPDLAREPRAARRREASGLTRAQPWTTPKNQTLSSYSGTTQDDNYNLYAPG